ncbi:MAG: hypothetical protein R3301_06560 [Saprospiraceae bacterium]|nr:hypothetical protein [Saprospiraceae bacterium]
MKQVIRLVACIALCALVGCASYRMHMPAQDPDPVASGEIVHKIFLVGDAGEASHAQTTILSQMTAQLNAYGGEATVLYLGDNIYPEGLPPVKDTFPEIALKDSIKARPYAEGALLPQINAVLEAQADVRGYFVPGNHDWKKGKASGLKQVRRQGAFIEEHGNDIVHMLPEDGCPGPEEVEIGDDLVLLLIDSQWWLHNWSKEKGINEDCDAQSRLDFLAALKEAVSDNKEKQIVIVMHHPLISAGPHGGYYGLKDHLFPLTLVEDWLYVPIPFLYPILRGTFGNVQDIVHHKYYDLKKGVREALGQYERPAILVSGHEHVLEHHVYRDDHYIVSGSGARHPNQIGKPASMRFGHGANGYMVMDVMASGEINLHVYETQTGETPVYSTKLVDGIATTEDLPDLPPQEALTDSTETVISDEYAKSGLYRVFFGERYRALYNTPVNARNINLAEARGGLEPVKKGGGFQTNSLRLEDKDGRQYVLRGLKKDATRLLPDVFQSTFAMDILQDQFTASHPYAAFVIPEMASAAGIYHTNPELVYLPAQQALGRYSADFAEGLYLYEERPDGDWSDSRNFGGSDELMSYSDVVEETIEKYTHRVDQEFVLRSRLFDMIIGDWDRHDDQWRWASFDNPDGKGKLYRPVPRDRDQAFSTYDGLIVKLANWYTPALRKMSVFTDEIKRIKWFNFNARYFDRDFLNMLTREQWVEIASDLRNRLTDDVIERSLRSWPQGIFSEQGERIIEILKGRRDKIVEFANRYYDVLARTVMIRGTEDADYFLITRLAGATRVRVFDSNKEGDRNDLYYDRTFSNGETNNIQIYGLDGRDHFVIEGEARGGIKVNLVGGEGRDTFDETDGVRRKRLLAQDTHNPERNPTDAIPYREVFDDEDNAYDRLSFEYDYGIPLIILGGNPDDGLLVGGGVQIVRHGFKKEPFASRHSIQGFYATASGSYGFEYRGEWNEVLGNTGVGLETRYLTPNYVQNFFGLGNDSEEMVDDIDFYRVRKRNYAVVPSIRFGHDEGHSASLHAGYESHQIERTPGRFIADPENGLPESVFEEQGFVVARFDYSFQIVDQPLLTRRGLRFRVSTGIDRNFEMDMTHRYFKASLATYYQLKYLGKPVIATRVGTEFHGGEYQFYQGAILGFQSNFRGMPKERFVGQKSFYHNTDIRFRLSQLRSYYLPSAVGVTLTFDHGRVWTENDNSDTWHYAYGGGVWFSPFYTLLLSLNYHVSDVDERISVGMGFFF